MEISDARQHKRSRRQAIALLVAAGVVVTAGFAGTFAWSTATQAQLTDAQDAVASARKQQTQYASVLDAQTQTATVNRQLATLMANDLRWAGLVTSLRATAPSGLSFTSINGTVGAAAGPAGVGGAPAAGAAPGARLPDATGERLVGSMTISGKARAKTDVATYLNTLRATPGVGNPMLDGITQQPKSGVEFTLHLDITATALGGRHSTTNGGR
ncbi:hypothetical protein GCM10010201_07970 [Pilimelia columellifera subsp. columellifera]|uniref:Uncharacterized protein n=1 Tax=Pilimelia columellifera subsp. columellifera TaxID=706583 RepID=A0ABP6AIG6_9ACTN